MATSTGWTLDDAGSIDIPRLTHLQRYWDRCPPTHVSAYLLAVSLGAIEKTGVQHQKPAEHTDQGENNLGELLGNFPVLPPPQGVDVDAMTIDERKALAMRMAFGDILPGMPKAKT